MNLSYAAAHALLKNIADYTMTDFAALGITEQMFETTAMPIPWRRDQIPNVMRTLQMLIHGSLELHGMPKTVVPAEYVACVITAVVGNCNKRLACIWLAEERQSGAPIAELSARVQTSPGLAPATEGQLFALVALLSATDAASKARADMVQKLALQTVELLENQNETEEDDYRQTQTRQKKR